MSKNQLLEVKNIARVFDVDGNKLYALQGINLKLYQNESISIVGPSGAGKSTLLHILGLLDDATDGELDFAGKNISNLNEKEKSSLRNKEIGFVFQFHHLLPEFTILENVIMPALILNSGNKNTIKKGKEILEKVGLSSKINSRPNEISGGEQQRAAVARALINLPSLILADEPTGNLDSENAKLVYSLLFDLQKENKTSIIIVTHNKELSNKTDRRITLIDGKISKEEIL